MKLPWNYVWPFSKSEKRAGAYTDAFIQAAMAQAATKQYSARDTAVAVLASNSAARAFALADLVPVSGMGASMVSDVLKSHIYDIVRSLVLDGECVYELTTQDGLFAMRRCSSWDVLSGRSVNERGWRYNTYTSGPGGQSSRNMGSEGVVHFRINTEAISPWRGRSPFDNDTARALAAIEIAIEREANSPFGYVLDLPAPESDEIAAKREEAIRGMKGNIFVSESSRHPRWVWMHVDHTHPSVSALVHLNPSITCESNWNVRLANAAGMPIELCE